MAEIFRIRDIRETISLLESVGFCIDDIDKPLEVIHFSMMVRSEFPSLSEGVKNVLSNYEDNARLRIERDGVLYLWG
jgi:hypothetical protein